MKLLRVFLWILVLLPLTACGLSGGPIEGQVLEVGTRKPLPDAIVTVTWQGSYFQIAESRTQCYHVESATTDQQGRYKIPKWHESTKGPFFSAGPFWIEVYKAGYEAYFPPGNFDRTEDYKNNIRFLAVFKGTSGERLEQLKRINDVTTCFESKVSKKSLTLQKAIYQEARNIAQTSQDKKVVEILLFGLESEQFGSMNALKRMDDRKRGATE